MNVATIAQESLINSIFLPRNLDYSSDSFVEPIDKIEEQVINDEFIILKEDIGEDLFNQLSYNNKLFMIETAGSIDYGRAIDLDKVAEEIENYEL